MSRRGRNGKDRRQVKIPGRLHSALVEMQREFKKKRGEEPALGDLVEMAFEEDPIFEEVLSEDRRENQSVWNEDFMRL